MAINNGHLLVSSLVREEQNDGRRKRKKLGSSTSFKGPSTIHHKEVEAYNSDYSNGV